MFTSSLLWYALLMMSCLMGTTVRAWQFTGLFQVSDTAANCTHCLNDDPATAQCGCPAASLSTTMRNLNDCEGRGTLAGSNVVSCYVNDFTYSAGAFGGVFQLDDAVVGSLGCRSPNVATNACNCPFGFKEIVMRAMVDTPLQRDLAIGSSVVVCVNASADAALRAAAWFGGAFQLLDSGRCAASNPFTSNCSCPDDAPRMNRFRAVADGPEGGYITVCVPSLAPPPLPPSSGGNPLYFYVATTGNDAFSGTSPLFPFRTIARAMAVVASTAAEHRGNNITIRVFEGLYPQASTLKWASPSCGDRSQRTYVALVAYPEGARVVVSGGVDVASSFAHIRSDDTVEWFHGNVAAVAPQQFVWQMWRAQSSSLNFTRVSLVAGETQAYAALLSPDPPIQVQLAPSQAPPFGIDLSSSFVVMYHSWTSTTNAVQSIDPATHVLTVEGSEPDNTYNAASGNRFRFLNLPPWFLTPGNHSSPTAQPWSYFMNKTTKDILLAVPRGIFNLSTLIVPTLRTVLSVEGPNCENIIIRGITVAHTDSFLQEQCLSTGCSGQSGSFLAGAGIELSGEVVGALLENVSVAHMGGYGLWVHGGTNTITVDNAHVHDLGAGGVRLGEAASGEISDRSQLASNIVVMNSVIHDGGHIVEAGAGVLLQQAASCTIRNNEIFDLFYTAVSTGWNWGYAPTSNHNIVVQFNLMYNIGRGVLSDMGCVYNLGTSPGTLVDHNICHDLQSFGYGGWGLYSDEGTSLVQWSNNIVFRTKSAPYHQHYGMHNNIFNNVFAFPQVTLGQPLNESHGDFAGVRSSPAASGPEHQTSFSLQRNIILLRNASASLFYSTIEEAFINVTANENVYFNTAASVGSLEFPCFRGVNALHCTFQQWQSLGEDIVSNVSNPLFTNADAYDFTDIAAGSPALRLGFQPISTANIGPNK